MMMRLANLSILLLVLVLGATVACKTTPTASGSAVTAPELTGRLYTAYNIWFERPMDIASINYKRGAIIPAGSEVSNITVEPGRRGRVKINFVSIDSGATYSITFNPKYHPGLTINEFQRRLFTNKSFRQQTNDMTRKEIEAIKDGVLVPGMSRDAVIMAYGYPPEIFTPTLKSRVWMYQISRAQTKSVTFGDDGLTRGPRAAARDEL